MRNKSFPHTCFTLQSDGEVFCRIDDFIKFLIQELLLFYQLFNSGILSELNCLQ